MSTISSVAKIGEAIASWLDPEKREKRILRGAIEAGEELLKILRKQGRYKFMVDRRLKEMEIHYQKQWDAWKDGTS